MLLLSEFLDSMQTQRLVIALLCAPLMELGANISALAQVPSSGDLAPDANQERQLSPDLEESLDNTQDGLDQPDPNVSPEEPVFIDISDVPQVTDICVSDDTDTQDRFPAPLPSNGRRPGQALVYDTEALQELLSQVLTASRQGTSEFSRRNDSPEITLTELCAWAKAITLKYVQDGYLTSQAIVPSSSPTELQVYEGLLANEDIEIEGLNRLREGYVRDRLLLGIDTPLRIQDLEAQLQILRRDPLFDKVSASIGPKTGASISESQLRVKITESDLLDGTLSYDNDSPESLGTNRFETELVFRNMSGIGDTLTTSWRQTGELGSRLHLFSYEAPFNAEGGTIRLETNVGRSRIVNEPFNQFDIEDRSGQYQISLRQPVWRTAQDEFALSIGYGYRQSQTTVLNQGTQLGAGPEEDGHTRLSVIRFSQDYIRRDPQGAWVMQSQFNWGNDWFGATSQEDGIPDSQFLSWLGKGARYQYLDDSRQHLLIGRLDLQLTTDALLSPEQFVVGGGQSVRGYRQNARSGDNGLRISLEDRITLRRSTTGSPSVQLIPFWDLGYVWSHPSNPNVTPTQRLLSSVGIGGWWQPLPDFTVQVDYGLPLTPIADNGSDLLQGHGLHFNLDYEF